MFRWNLSATVSVWRAAWVFVLTALPLAAGCGQSVTLKEIPTVTKRSPQAVFFEDVTEAKGLPTKQAPWPDGTCIDPLSVNSQMRRV